MPRIEFSTEVAAPIERVFDLSRSVPAHLESARHTGELLVSGPTGLLTLGDEVTWEARHLGVRQRLSVRISEYDPPRHFRDSMVSGAFSRFDHDHFFQADHTGTTVREVFDYTSPLWVLGHAADLLFLKQYMWRFLTRRAGILKRIAESDDWPQYVVGSP